MANCLVIIPTYNEKENISTVIKAIFSLCEDFHILVIDDASPDGTAAVVSDLIPKFPEKLFLEVRPGKMGLGSAYINGFRWGLRRRYDYIFEMDADFSHNPDDLSRLLKNCADGDADICIGSRYVKGGTIVNWSWSRMLLSYFASVYVRVLTRIPVRDTTAGFICYKRKVLETIPLDTICFNGYAFQIEMKLASWKLGFRIQEIPIAFTERKEGESKMDRRIIQEAVLGVLQLSLRNLFRNRYDSVGKRTSREGHFDGH